MPWLADETLLTCPLCKHGGVRILLGHDAPPRVPGGVDGAYIAPPDRRKIADHDFPLVWDDAQRLLGVGCPLSGVTVQL